MMKAMTRWPPGYVFAPENIKKEYKTHRFKF